MSRLVNSSVTKVERIRTKFKDAIDSSNYYEAHQMLKTLYFRMSGVPELYSDLKRVLHESCLLLFKHGERESASDLFKCFIELLQKHVSELTTGGQIDEDLQNLVSLHEALPTRSTDHDTIVCGMFKWANSINSKSFSTSKLHSLLATNYLQKCCYPLSYKHFILSNFQDESEISQFASLLVKFHFEKGFRCSELDLFIVGACLHLLSKSGESKSQTADTEEVGHDDGENKKKADFSRRLLKCDFILNLLFDYCEKHPLIQKREPPYKFPLLNFTWFILLLVMKNDDIDSSPTTTEKENEYLKCEESKIKIFNILLVKYNKHLLRDPQFFTYLDKIGQHHFGVPPVVTPQPRPSNNLSTLIESFFGGRDKDRRTTPSSSSVATANTTMDDCSDLD